MTQLIKDEEIYQFVKKEKSATLSDIRAAFDISESTVRRILARLEDSGFLCRFRGGAIALPAKLTAYDRRLDEFSAEKSAIARKAMEHIKEDSKIILLGGTTVNSICPYLANKKLHVITNSLTVIDQLKDSPNIRLIALGGVYNHDEYEFIGNVTIMGLRFMRADYLFMSCNGFSPETGFMTNEIDSVEFYRLCMTNADKTIVLATSAKAKLKGIAAYAGADEIDTLITDTGLDAETVEAFTEMQVKISLAGRE